MELVLKINNFEGPLDLLLSLIEKKKMKISEISIAELIDEYLEIINASKREDIYIKSEFIITASELIEIKFLKRLLQKFLYLKMNIIFLIQEEKEERL